MWSRSLLVQNLLVPKKAKPHDNDADSADAVAERPVSSETQIVPPLSGNFERALVNAVLSGEAGAASRFLEHVSTTLWSIVVRLAGDGADAEAAFLHIVASLKADDYARLRGFDGRSRLRTYLSLVARCSRRPAGGTIQQDAARGVGTILALLRDRHSKPDWQTIAKQAR